MKNKKSNIKSLIIVKRKWNINKDKNEKSKINEEDLKRKNEKLQAQANDLNVTISKFSNGQISLTCCMINK